MRLSLFGACAVMLQLLLSADGLAPPTAPSPRSGTVLPPLREANERILLSLKVDVSTAARILDDSRMTGIDLGKRIAELRETAGLTRVSLKKYLNAYPDVCIGLFADPVKTCKSVVMRVLKLSEQQYTDGTKRIVLQTNNKAGAIFRGNFPFIVDSLREMAGFQQADLTFLFIHYPTIFTLDYKTVASHLGFLRRTVGYSEEQLRLLLLRNCRSALCSNERALALASFFETELQISREGFCELTVAHPRLFGVSLPNTLQPKLQQLLDEESWGLSRERLADVIQKAPSVLTTPAATTLRVWLLLHSELGLTKEQCQDVVRKYPNLLRVNVQTLRRKLCSLTLAEVALILQQRLGLPGPRGDDGDVGDAGEVAGAGAGQGKQKKQIKSKDSRSAASDSALADAADFDFARDSQALYSEIAAALLQLAPVALTCSLERIDQRMRALGAGDGLDAAAAAAAAAAAVDSGTVDWGGADSDSGADPDADADSGADSDADADADTGGLALGSRGMHILLAGSADRLRALRQYWNSQGPASPFPVLPSTVTVSAAKFAALLAARERALEG